MIFFKEKLKLIFLLLSLCTLFTSCSKEASYGAMDMYMMAYEFDKTIEEVRVTDPSQSLRCEMYPPGCVDGSAKRFKVRLVDLVVVQFHTAKKACLAAKKLNQFYIRNWLLDDVKGEPVLESFVKEVYKAKNPKDCHQP